MFAAQSFDSSRGRIYWFFSQIKHAGLSCDGKFEIKLEKKEKEKKCVTNCSQNIKKNTHSQYNIYSLNVGNQIISQKKTYSIQH